MIVVDCDSFDGPVAPAPELRPVFPGTEAPYLMVFDVESVGLHGEGFAVGYVVVCPDGHEIEGRRCSCQPVEALGDPEAMEWVDKNVPFRKWFMNRQPFDHTTLSHPANVRNWFWRRWSLWRERGALLAADVTWPVEANFLRHCIGDDELRATEAPYPLLDVASVLFAAGGNPVGAFTRLESELPAHDPLADARQSARILFETLQAIRDRG